MASDTLPPKYIEAGEAYLSAVHSLGLYPEFLGWGQDLASRDWLLVMVTGIVEVGGPLALNRLLFNAYNLHATPKEISPFIVRIFGSRTLLAAEFTKMNSFRRGEVFIKDVERAGKKIDISKVKVESMAQDIAGIHIESQNAYLLDKRRRGYEQKTREWIKFKHNVEKLAA